MTRLRPPIRRLLGVASITIAIALGVLGAGLLYLRTTAPAAAAESVAVASTEEDGAEQGEEAAAVPVEVEVAFRAALSSYLSAAANLVAEDEVSVLAEVEGRVELLGAEEGDRVRSGDVLATLVRDDEKIALQTAEVRAANARLSFERAATMSEQGLIPQESLEKITMEHRIAEQELAEARWALERTRIRAPFDGRITRRAVTVGQHLRPGDELFVLTDFDPLIARIYLPEKDVVGLGEDRAVWFTLQADPSVRFPGRIRHISPVVDASTGTVKLTIEALNPPPTVRPGGFVTVDIVRETRHGAIVVPREALVRELQATHLFVVQDGAAQRRSVTLGIEEDDRVQVTGGVEAGEPVVVAGQGSLKDGAKVKVVEGQPAAAAPDPAPRRG